MISSENPSDITELVTALAKAQSEFPDIKRDRVVKVSSQRGDYEFRYATLGEIIKSVRPSLAKHGIAFTQTIEYSLNEGLYFLTTSLLHKNQKITSKLPLIVQQPGNQQFGSALTYMRRYTLAAMLGIAPDEDDDGNMADGNEVQGMQESVNKAAPKSKPPTPVADPISTGLMPPMPTGEFVPAKIDVPLLADESGSDWMEWGKLYMAQARLADSQVALKALNDANEVPLKNMEAYAPKLYKNLSAAFAKVFKELEPKNAA